MSTLTTLYATHKESAGFHRPTRGVVRLDGLSFDSKALIRDVDKVVQSHAWIPMAYGDTWSRIDLCQDEHQEEVLDECPAIRQVMQSFNGKILDVCLARLGPGGWIKEHRDITGGVPMGVARFHIPITTHPDVEFYVNGNRIFLGPGEVWNLDTTYRHKLNNKSDVWRIHLIVDVELSPSIRSLLPATDMAERLHRIYFWWICCAKGIQQAVVNPRALVKRLKQVFRLRVLKKSSL